MSVPEEVYKSALSVDEDANKIIITCPECSDYDKKVDGDDYDDAEKAFQQAKRQIASHFSQKHMDGGQGASTSSNEGNANQGKPPQGQGQSGGGPPPQQQQSSSGISERELIYQQGEDGLNRIKKERLKEWLTDLEGVGGQAESRIMRMFEKNDSAKTDPNVLYNIISRETTTSPAYINTMVQDIFEPEREHEDLLREHGFMPWFKRSGNSSQGGFGSFQPQQGGMQQQGMQYSQGGGMGMQQGRGGPQQQQGMRGAQQRGRQQQSSQQDMQGDEPIGRHEAAAMVEQAMEAADEGEERNALVSGLSEATDAAIKEAATNVGGLAGTLHNVIDEALVNYARENPEWVIENMGLLQSFMDKTSEIDPPDNGSESQNNNRASEVDNAVQAVEQGNIDESPSQPQQQSHRGANQVEQNPMKSTPRSRRQQPRDGRGGGKQQKQNSPSQSQDSQFEPSQETKDAIEEHQKDKQESGGNPEPKSEPPESPPKPSGEVSEKSKEIRENFESPSDESGKTTSGDDDFDEIFGDMAE